MLSRAIDAERAEMGATKHQGAAHTQKARSMIMLVAAFAAVYVIWGSTYLGIKYAIETLPPFLMSGWRFLLAGAALTLWAVWRRGERPTVAQWRSAGVVGTLLFLGGNGGVVWAEQYIASGLAALLVATEPLWIVLLNWARPNGVRPAGKTFVGLLIGFAGVWLLIGSDTAASSGEVGSANIIGAIVVIAAALSWAIGSLYSLRATLPASPILSAGMQMITGGALLTLAGTLSGEWMRLNLAHASAISVGAFLYLIVFGSIIAFTAYSWLLRNVSPARAATYAYVNPGVAVLLGWAVAGESLNARMLLAAAVIVSAVWLITSREKHGEPERTDNKISSAPCGGAEPIACSEKL